MHCPSISPVLSETFGTFSIRGSDCEPKDLFIQSVARIRGSEHYKICDAKTEVNNELFGTARSLFVQ
ncbi:hypothetical protein I7I48_08912 [Histoplasma ohiense]|nr:hypothetical protein I7I48_08912 [Histoplasma ohiense (nom. inval.)]